MKTYLEAKNRLETILSEYIKGKEADKARDANSIFGKASQFISKLSGIDHDVRIDHALKFQQTINQYLTENADVKENDDAVDQLIRFVWKSITHAKEKNLTLSNRLIKLIANWTLDTFDPNDLWLKLEAKIIKDENQNNDNPSVFTEIDALNLLQAQFIQLIEKQDWKKLKTKLHELKAQYFLKNMIDNAMAKKSVEMEFQEKNSGDEKNISNSKNDFSIFLLEYISNQNHIDKLIRKMDASQKMQIKIIIQKHIDLLFNILTKGMFNLKCVEINKTVLKMLRVIRSNKFIYIPDKTTENSLFLRKLC